MARTKWSFSEAIGISIDHYRNGRQPPEKEPSILALEGLLITYYGPPGSPLPKRPFPSLVNYGGPTMDEVKAIWRDAPEPKSGIEGLGEVLGSVLSGGVAGLLGTPQAQPFVQQASRRAGSDKFFSFLDNLTPGKIIGFLLVGGLVYYGIQGKNPFQQKPKPKRKRRASAPAKRTTKAKGKPRGTSAKGYPKTVTFKNGTKKRFSSAKAYMAYIRKKK